MLFFQVQHDTKTKQKELRKATLQIDVTALLSLEGYADLAWRKEARFISDRGKSVCCSIALSLNHTMLKMPLLTTIQMAFIFYRNLMNNLGKFSISFEKVCTFLKWKFRIYNKTNNEIAIKYLNLTSLILASENI